MVISQRLSSQFHGQGSLEPWSAKSKSKALTTTPHWLFPVLWSTPFLLIPQLSLRLKPGSAYLFRLCSTIDASDWAWPVKQTFLILTINIKNVSEFPFYTTNFVSLWLCHKNAPLAWILACFLLAGFKAMLTQNIQPDCVKVLHFKYTCSFSFLISFWKY